MRRLCTFQIADTRYGIPIESVQEILRSPALATVPQAPAWVKGIFNLRGQILTSLDLARALGGPPADDARRLPHVVVRQGSDTVGLAVDRVGDVESVDDAPGEPPPANLPPAARPFVREAHALAARPVLVLDVEKLMDLA